MKLLISTRNPGKLAEINAMFQVPGLELVTLNDVPNAPEVLEDGDTFVLNAIKKAVVLALMSKLWTLADDSGLEVDALDGRPGVISARYAGEPSDAVKNIEKILGEMKGKQSRAAHFVTVIALASPSGRSQIVEGRCDGSLTSECRGSSGFGYDPIFVPQGYTQTFAEMAAEQKNAISHRAKALQKAKDAWQECFASEGRVWT